MALNREDCLFLERELDRAWRQQCEDDSRRARQHPLVIRAYLWVNWIEALKC